MHEKSYSAGAQMATSIKAKQFEFIRQVILEIFASEALHLESSEQKRFQQGNDQVQRCGSKWLEDYLPKILNCFD